MILQLAYSCVLKYKLLHPGIIRIGSIAIHNHASSETDLYLSFIINYKFKILLRFMGNALQFIFFDRVVI